MHRGDDLLALAVAGRLDEVGELRRVQARELRVRRAQPDGRDVTGERLELAQSSTTLLAGTRSREPPREDAADDPARPDIDADDAPPAVAAGELDVVRAPQARPVDVDQLTVEDVLAQQHLVGPALERAQVEPVGGERDASVVELGDRVAGYDDGVPGHPREHRGDRRVVVVAEPDEQVVDAPELRAGATDAGRSRGRARDGAAADRSLAPEKATPRGGRKSCRAGFRVC